MNNQLFIPCDSVLSSEDVHAITQLREACVEMGMVLEDTPWLKKRNLEFWKNVYELACKTSARDPILLVVDSEPFSGKGYAPRAARRQCEWDDIPRFKRS
jgi:hypothetical protein